MTMVSRIKSLTTSILQAGSDKTDAEELEAYAGRADALEELANPFNLVTSCMANFKAYGIQIPEESLPKERSSELKRIVDSIDIQFKSEPKSILNPSTNWRHRTTPQLKQIPPHMLESVLLDAWKEHVKSLTPQIDSGLLLVIKSSPSHQGRAQDIEEMVSEFSTIGNRLPQNQQEIERPQKLQVALSKAVEDLPTDVPTFIRDLFIAIQDGSATVSHLTDEVMEWLRDQDLLDAIRLTWR